MPRPNRDDDEIAPAFFTLRAAETYSGLRKWQWAELIRRKKIESVMPFKKRLIPKSEVDRILGISPQP
jgi:hypothetical protein